MFSHGCGLSKWRKFFNPPDWHVCVRTWRICFGLTKKNNREFSRNLYCTFVWGRFALEFSISTISVASHIMYRYGVYFEPSMDGHTWYPSTTPTLVVNSSDPGTWCNINFVPEESLSKPPPPSLGPSSAPRLSLSAKTSLTNLSSVRTHLITGKIKALDECLTSAKGRSSRLEIARIIQNLNDSTIKL